MRNKSWWLVALLALYVGLAGAQACGKKADSALQSAGRAVDEARAVDAGKWAPAEFRSAEEGLSQAQGLFKKWQFKKSEQSAATAESQARLARKIALEKKLAAEEADKLARGNSPSLTENQFSAPNPGDQLLKDVGFDFNSASLSAEGRATATANAAVMKARPNLRVRIEGHCDERGTDEYNLALGAKRAKEVKEFLVRQGISASRMETLSLGESVPLDQGHDEAAWAKNRRAHFGVVP